MQHRMAEAGEMLFIAAYGFAAECGLLARIQSFARNYILGDLRVVAIYVQAMCLALPCHQNFFSARVNGNNFGGVL